MRWFALVVFTACSSSAPTPAPEAARPCEATITAAIGRITKSDKLDDAERTKLTMTASCESEHWSAEALDCIASARLAVDLRACTEKLTYEQHERLGRKLATLHPDAGIDAPPPADAAVDAAIDAAVHVDAAIVHRPTPDANPDDCKVLDPHNLNCVRQWCKHHPDDLRCDIE